MNAPTENEVRRLRDVVFESASTDHNWEFCKAAWQQPDSVAWLRDQSEKLNGRTASMPDRGETQIGAPTNL